MKYNKCPYCSGKYKKTIDKHELVCEKCGYIYKSETWKPGRKSEYYE